MTLASLPSYDVLPAPLWIITLLHVLTLTLHFVAMNFMLGGIVILLFGRFENRWAHPVAKTFLKLFPTLMAATVTLAVAPLLFTQLTFGSVVYASSIVSGWFWFLVPIVVMVAYYFLYGAALAKEGNPKVRIWVTVALVCLVYVSIVQSNVFSLAERPELQKSLYASTQTGLVLNPEIGEWLFRWLHMLAGAVTVGSFLFAVLGRAHEDVQLTSRRFFLWGMIASGVTGLVYLMTLDDALRPFMRSPGIMTLTAGVVLSIVAIPFFLKRRFVASGALLFLSLGGMVLARHSLRLVVLPEAMTPSVLYEGKIEPQWDVFALFVVCFLAALVVIAWMLKIFFGKRAEEV